MRARVGRPQGVPAYFSAYDWAGSGADGARRLRLREIVGHDGGRRPASPGSPDEPQAELGELLGFGRRWRLEHEVGARLRLRERHDLADVRLMAEDHRPAVDAQGDPAVRRRSELERVKDRPELRPHPIEGLALEREAALEQIALMDPDAPAAELPAVEGEIVLEGPGPTGRVVRRRREQVAADGREQVDVAPARRR